MSKSLPVWFPFVAPFVAFLLLTGIEPRFAAHYPLFYTVKIVLVGALLIALRRHLPEVRPGGSGIALATLTGVLLFFVWIGLDRLTPHFAFLGRREGYDPFAEIADARLRTAFLCVRFFGLCVMVPLVEEIFYRGFLLRFVTDLDDFRRAPIGKLTFGAVAVNVVGMALTHPEWLAAAVFSLSMCLLLIRTRNLFACVLAHGVTNLMLGVYVLQTHDWKYW